MGRKLNEASRKICKPENKNQMNSLIKVLRPKVYITEASNFKNLVQQLTGNFIQEPVNDSPIMDIKNHCYTENSLEWSSSSLEYSSQDSLLSSSDLTSSTSSPQSLPPSNFTSLASSPQEGYAVPETIFNMLESSFANNNNNNINAFGDIESWLLEIDSSSCNWNNAAFDDQIPAAMAELFADCSDFADLW